MTCARKIRSVPLALGALLITLALPQHSQAAVYHPTVVTDAYHGATDAALGISTHWECATDLADPTSPFACTRTPNATPTTMPGAVPQARFDALIVALGAAAPRMTPRVAPANIAGPTSCEYAGGIRIWQYVEYAGNCARFTGTGNLDLTQVSYPGPVSLVLFA